MKLKQEFILRSIAGDNILIPVVSCEDKFQGLMTLNETAVFIWNKIVEGKDKEEIVSMLLDEYDVTQEQAKKNVDDFCNQLIKLGIL